MAAIPVLKRFGIKMQQAISEHIKDKGIAQHKVKDEIAVTKTKFKAFRRLLAEDGGQPLTSIARTSIGLAGQPIGSVTLAPSEVYRITIDTWAAIHEGNQRDLQTDAGTFIEDLDNQRLLYKASEFLLDDLTGKDIMEGIDNAKKSAAGLDQWSPSEFSLLSLYACQQLAILRNTIESGAKWPDALRDARAAFLPKDMDDPTNPLADRVLLIMPTLYRRWASVRLKQLLPWTKQWGLEDMVAGVEGVGAEDGWWETSFQLEAARLKEQPATGGATDVYKCFDQINRGNVYAMAKVAGMPRIIIDTYQRFQED